MTGSTPDPLYATGNHGPRPPCSPDRVRDTATRSYRSGSPRTVARPPKGSTTTNASRSSMGVSRQSPGRVRPESTYAAISCGPSWTTSNGRRDITNASVSCMSTSRQESGPHARRTTGSASGSGRGGPDNARDPTWTRVGARRRVILTLRSEIACPEPWANRRRHPTGRIGPFPLPTKP